MVVDLLNSLPIPDLLVAYVSLEYIDRGTYKTCSKGFDLKSSFFRSVEHTVFVLTNPVKLK